MQLDVFYQSFPDDVKERVTLKLFPFPPTLLDILWNRLHILPIEWLIGHVDVFWSSDWTQPPLSNAKGITTIHDLTTYRFPDSFPKEIVSVHRRKLARSIKICTVFLCDSDTTKQDAERILGIHSSRLFIVYPGFKLN